MSLLPALYLLVAQMLSTYSLLSFKSTLFSVIPYCLLLACLCHCRYLNVASYSRDLVFLFEACLTQLICTGVAASRFTKAATAWSHVSAFIAAIVNDHNIYY